MNEIEKLFYVLPIISMAKIRASHLLFCPNCLTQGVNDIGLDKVELKGICYNNQKFYPVVFCGNCGTMFFIDITPSLARTSEYDPTEDYYKERNAFVETLLTYIYNNQFSNSQKLIDNLSKL